MNSDFLTMIGLGGIDIGYILVGIVAMLLILLIILIVLIVKYSKIKKRYDKFMRGKNASSLEDDMHGVFCGGDIIDTDHVGANLCCR